MIGRRGFIGGALGLLTARLFRGNGRGTGADGETEWPEPPPTFRIEKPKTETIEITRATYQGDQVFGYVVRADDGDGMVTVQVGRDYIVSMEDGHNRFAGPLLMLDEPVVLNDDGTVGRAQS